MVRNSGSPRPQTEALGSETGYLEELPTDRLVSTLLDSQANAIMAMRKAAPQIEAAIERAATILRKPGSRIVYCGAGTSGRVALLDAVELSPTFNWPEERMQVLLAGGEKSLFEAQEGAEDDRDFAGKALRAIDPGPSDVVVCLAASGTTPFVLEIAARARQVGAMTVGMANNEDAPLLAMVDCPVFLDTGPEALAGSTRLTAGTSQKIALNIFSTSLMVRLGKVYRGRMVDMRATNDKLRSRAVAMVMDITGCDEDKASAALEATGYNVKLAVLVAQGAEPSDGERWLDEADGDLGMAAKRLAGASKAAR